MYELRVLTGLHRGAALPLSGGQWRIGSSSEADLALYDPGIQTEHCLLERRGDAWALSACEGQIGDGEGHRVSEIDPLQPDTLFALGGVWLTLVSADKEWPAEEQEDNTAGTEQQELVESDAAPATTELAAPSEDRPPVPRRSRNWPGMLTLGASVTLAIATGWIMTGQAAIPEKPQVTRPRPSLEAGKTTLLKMIRDRELNRQLSLTVEGDNLVLHGSIGESEQEMVQRMLVRFDRQYNGELKVIDRTTPLVSALPFTIVQINGGPRAHIVTTTGRRIFVGDEIDGLRLVLLDNKHLKFEGNQQIEVTW